MKSEVKPKLSSQQHGLASSSTSSTSSSNTPPTPQASHAPSKPAAGSPEKVKSKVSVVCASVLGGGRRGGGAMELADSQTCLIEKFIYEFL